MKLPRTRSSLSEKAATWVFGDPGVIEVEAVQEGFTARQKRLTPILSLKLLLQLTGRTIEMFIEAMVPRL